MTPFGSFEDPGTEISSTHFAGNVFNTKFPKKEYSVQILRFSQIAPDRTVQVSINPSTSNNKFLQITSNP